MGNPTGYWVTGSGNVGQTIDVRPGVKKTYTIVSTTLIFHLTQMYVAAKSFEVGTIMSGIYGLATGVYTIGTSGCKRVQDCLGAGDDERTIRKKMQDFTLRDQRGVHGSDATVYGPCSRKIDGVFCYLTSKFGEAVLQFRNGEKWIGTTNFDIECAFELVGDVLYLLYVDCYKNNRVELKKDLQDYFRVQLEFLVSLYKTPGVVDQFLTSTMTDASLPSDGIVIWNVKQNFFKEHNTVDITKSMAKDLVERGIYLDVYNCLYSDRLYEYMIMDNGEMLYVKERVTRSKFLPNMPKNVDQTILDPNLTALRDQHRQCAGSANECEICKFI
jgi:hypothetical protein